MISFGINLTTWWCRRKRGRGGVYVWTHMFQLEKSLFRLKKTLKLCSRMFLRRQAVYSFTKELQRNIHRIVENIKSMIPTTKITDSLAGHEIQKKSEKPTFRPGTETYVIRRKKTRVHSSFNFRRQNKLVWSVFDTPEHGGEGGGGALKYDMLDDVPHDFFSVFIWNS